MSNQSLKGGRISVDIIDGKKIDGQVIDWYHLNPLCVCYDCKKHDVYAKNGPYSCPAYPNINGIPREIWNTPHAYCRYFEPIKEE